jgi:hypothetical protein
MLINYLKVRKKKINNKKINEMEGKDLKECKEFYKNQYIFQNY